jgi:hypothetical protein
MEFSSGVRQLHHHELFGLATNMVNVEKGIKIFMEILFKYPHFYDNSEKKKWNYYLPYFRDQGYYKQSCNRFCPYRDTCKHGTNILSTVKPKPHTIERIPGYVEEFHPIEEVQNDVKEKLIQAIESEDTLWHIIKAQTAIGKTATYFDIMMTFGKRFLIAVPTNVLKKEIYKRAIKMGLEGKMTPSLDEIKDSIPPAIWARISILRKSGKHSKVHRYICEMATKRLSTNNIYKLVRV